MSAALRNVVEELFVVILRIDTKIQNSCVDTKIQNSGVVNKIQNSGVDTKIQNSYVDTNIQNSNVDTRTKTSSVDTKIQTSSVDTRIPNSDPIAVDSRMKTTDSIRHCQDSRKTSSQNFGSSLVKSNKIQVSCLIKLIKNYLKLFKKKLI
jgi:hypothetical protein